MLLAFMGMAVPFATPLLTDNSALALMVRKDGASQRTRYFDRATMLVKECEMTNTVRTMLISTADELGDIFTKAVAKDILIKMRQYGYNLRVSSTDAMFAKASTLIGKLQSAVQLMRP